VLKVNKAVIKLEPVLVMQLHNKYSSRMGMQK